MAKKKYRNTKRLKASERIEIILENAINIIINNGFAEFSSRNVAEKSGIRLATLQYYFQTTKDLFKATFERALLRESERTQMLLTEAGDSPEKVLEARVLGQYRANKHPETAAFFFQLWAMANLDEFAAEIMDKFYLELVDDLSKSIQACNKALTDKEARHRAALIVPMIEGQTLFNMPDSSSVTKNLFCTEKLLLDTVMNIVRMPA